MKRYFSLLVGSLIIMFMLAAPGNTAQAATEDEHCGCDVTFLDGAERNKVVANLLKSDEFKTLKQELKKDGYTWNGANTIEVIKNNTYGGIILVGVPFVNEEGAVEFFGYTFLGGEFISF